MGVMGRVFQFRGIFIPYIYLEHVLPATASSWRQLVKIQLDIFSFCSFQLHSIPLLIARTQNRQRYRDIVDEHCVYICTRVP